MGAGRQRWQERDEAGQNTSKSTNAGLSVNDERFGGEKMVVVNDEQQ